MESMAELNLTKRELDVMSVLWERGEATATEVRERVDPDLAYTSISTVLRLLEMKGYVGHRQGDGKTHVYYPAIDSETVGEGTLTRILEKIYGGSPIKLLAHLVEKRKIPEKDLARMRELLNSRSKKR
jgi:BlaI family penicillinase repressor